MIVLFLGDAPQFTLQAAARSVTQYLRSDSYEFLPIVPFANGILDFSKIVNELGTRMVICHAI